MFDEDPGEGVAHVVREQVPEQVVVEDRSGHVVARSGSSAKPLTKRAWSSLLSRSLRSRLPSPLGTVKTPKPRSSTSTGPPPSRFHRCRTAAGSETCPDDETRYSC